MGTVSLADWVALNLLPGLGGVLAGRMLERFGDPGAIAFRLPAAALASVRGVGTATAERIVAARAGLARRAERELARCTKIGARVVPRDDDGFPAELHEIPDPPVLLYVRGAMPAPALRVAVVGARQATAYGRRVATGLGSGLAARGVEVVSGGARGIDTAAHSGALEERGRTVVVLGSGLARPYPEENRRLFERIAETGAWISELPLEAPPLAEHFPRRNRLISGLAAAVVVVEAAARSGSLATASRALEQGREVLAVPGPVSSPRSAGCHRLIQQGAKLVQNIDDILEELPPMYRAAPAFDARGADPDRGPDLDGLSPDEAAVLGIVEASEPVQLDDLADRAPFGISRLQAALFGLRLRGAIEQSPGRYYLSRPRKEE